MKKRYLYSLLFAMPGFFVSLLVAFLAFGAAAGLLWIYVFGDSPWPSAVNTAFPLSFVVVFLGLWSALAGFGYRYGKRREGIAGLNSKHVLIAVGATVAPIILYAVHQFSVGNIGPPSDSVLCSDFCREKGFSVSSIPPWDSGERCCSCLDELGREVIKIPLTSLVPGE